jgi:hypothetical protein
MDKIEEAKKDKKTDVRTENVEVIDVVRQKKARKLEEEFNRSLPDSIGTNFNASEDQDLDPKNIA